jgi:GNAT superfamily N-acetyltransferase
LRPRRRPNSPRRVPVVENGVENGVEIRVVGSPISDSHRSELANCWMEVANSGGAVGFPFLPVAIAAVAAAMDMLADEIERGDVILLEARCDETLVGWVTLRLNRSKLTAHWAAVERLQSHPAHRGIGVGARLLAAVVAHSRGVGLEHLHLALRGGEQLETFYERQGWQEIGRHIGALRLSEGDDRDEVFMTLRL